MDDEREVLESLLAELRELGFQPSLQSVLTAEQAGDLLLLARRAEPALEELASAGRGAGPIGR
jgi:hypothetical protein